MQNSFSILCSLFLIMLLSVHTAYAHDKETKFKKGGPDGDHIGSYNFMVEIDGVSASAYGLGEPTVTSLPIFEFAKERTDIELRLDSPILSFDPELRQKLDELIAAKGMTIRVVDVRTGQQMMAADFRGRIKRIRIRERASGADYGRANNDPITESISLSYETIKVTY